MKETIKRRIQTLRELTLLPIFKAKFYEIEMYSRCECEVYFIFLFFLFNAACISTLVLHAAGGALLANRKR